MTRCYAGNHVAYLWARQEDSLVDSSPPEVYHAHRAPDTEA